MAQEVGIRYNTNRIGLSLVGFNRDSNDLIDYVRINPTDVAFSPQNIQDVNTKGFETQFDYKFKVNTLNQKINLGYTFIEDEIKKSAVVESRYSINSLKHQVVGSYQMQWFKNFSNSIAYRYIERTSGISYNVVDLSAAYKLNDMELSVYANNIFNTEYSEASLIPMPKGNLMFGLKYDFR